MKILLLLVGVGIVLFIGAVLLRQRRWPSRKQPTTRPKQTDAGVDPVQKDFCPSSPDQPVAVHRVASPRPMDPRQRRQMLRYLKLACNQGPKARQAAMEDMVAWGHPTCLPLLRRGLRDADLRVVGLAARGLERFRGPRQRLRHPPRRSHRPRSHRPSPPA